MKERWVNGILSHNSVILKHFLKCLFYRYLENANTDCLVCIWVKIPCLDKIIKPNSYGHVYTQKIQSNF